MNGLGLGLGLEFYFEIFCGKKRFAHGTRSRRIAFILFNVIVNYVITVITSGGSSRPSRGAISSRTILNIWSKNMQKTREKFFTEKFVCENEKIYYCRGGGRPPRPPMDPPLVIT